MVTFCISIVILWIGYLVYGKFVEKMFGIDPKRTTPAITMADGVDYVPMKPWRIFLIQFLNIAGVGPICGAIMGAQFGTASFLWIVFGSIFAGAVHDFMSGMISLRHDGCSLPEIHGRYLGKGAKQIMRGFTVILMILVGVVFINTPATLLQDFTPDWNIYIWIVLIFVYYLSATLLPIDKVIGKIYPIFGILLIIMALAIVAAFIIYQPNIPEIWQGLENKHPDSANNPIFPMMFVSIACGAISGFHATQSPLMARCMVNERQGRPIFYGAMITEGVVALIWAAAAAYFFGPDSPVDTTGKGGPAMVGIIARHWFTPILATITVLGVISAAITSGDTALRSARLIVADFLKYNQKPIINRLLIALPIFIITAVILIYSLKDSKGFDIIWRYFAWANQLLSAVTLWAVTVYITKNKKKAWYLTTLIPALFMTFICTCFILCAPIGIHMSYDTGYIVSGVVTAFTLVWFYVWKLKNMKTA